MSITSDPVNPEPRYSQVVRPRSIISESERVYSKSVLEYTSFRNIATGSNAGRVVGGAVIHIVVVVGDVVVVDELVVVDCGTYTTSLVVGDVVVVDELVVVDCGTYTTSLVVQPTKNMVSTNRKMIVAIGIYFFMNLSLSVSDSLTESKISSIQVFCFLLQEKQHDHHRKKYDGYS
jgi:hypothetical protein